MNEIARIGGETPVNPSKQGYQYQPAVTRLSDGGFVVIWTDLHGDVAGFGVKMQIFNAAGAKVGAERHINNSIQGRQFEPSVTAADGYFIVTFTDHSGASDPSGGGIVRASYANNGSSRGSQSGVNTTTAGAQYDSAVAALNNDINNDSHFVVWTDASATGGDTSGTAIRGQIFSSNQKVGSEILINTTTAGDQAQASVTVVSGGYMVVWHDAGRLGGAIVSQKISSTGAKLGGETIVATGASSPAVSTLPGGGYVVVWQRESGSVGIEAARFDANGNMVGEVIPVRQTGSYLMDASVSVFPWGGFLVTWTDTSNVQDPNGYSVRGQVFDAAGIKVDSDFLVNTNTPNQQMDSSGFTLPDGASAWSGTTIMAAPIPKAGSSCSFTARPPTA